MKSASSPTSRWPNDARNRGKWASWLWYMSECLFGVCSSVALSLRCIRAQLERIAFSEFLLLQASSESSGNHCSNATFDRHANVYLCTLQAVWVQKR